MTGQNIFTRVTVRGDRERVYTRLAEDRSVFTFQIDKKSYRGRIYEREGPLLAFEPLDEFELDQNSEVIVSFSLSTEMYFMRTKLLLKRERRMIDLGGDLYKLQRRDNFRLVIPKSYKARFEARSYDLEEVKSTFSIIDLSGGGLSFEMLYATDSIRAGTHITGLLKIGDSFSKPVVAIVKHIRPFGSMGSGLFRCGIQFEGIPESDREEIIQLVMKIHREAFSKFSTL